jgi:hypothetical protein
MEHRARWTGSELLVWGGRELDPDDRAASRYPRQGAAYDPGHDRWRPMAEAPIPGRSRAAAVWTGTELVVWGGSNRSGARGDGAAYDPATDRWRAIADAPEVGGIGDAEGIWTGTELVVWGAPAAGPASSAIGLAYSPLQDTWRELPPSGLPPGRDESVTWTGSAMLVVTYPDDPAATAVAALYDPATDVWRPAAPSPLSAPSGSPSVVWTGREAVLAGGASAAGPADGVAYEPVSDCWRIIARPTFELLADKPAELVWDGDLVLMPGGAGGAYDPVLDVWLRLLTSHMVVYREYAAAAWTDDRLIVWGGNQGTGARGLRSDGVAFIPDR